MSFPYLLLFWGSSYCFILWIILEIANSRMTSFMFLINRLTKEHIQAMCKVVAKSSEDVKQSIRRARQKALDAIKKAGYPKDGAKRLEKEIDELTKKYVKSAEDMCKSKEKEISEG
uniref:Ribosome-recycling factor, chloroplastic n=1 Tax=Opuntia streptacantha TaxID=393608 RepID=A0A7C8ZVY2_OPUST